MEIKFGFSFFGSNRIQIESTASRSMIAASQMRDLLFRLVFEKKERKKERK